MNILVIGDIVGRPGRRAIRTLLPQIQKDHNIMFTIANAENAAGGRGLSREVMKELLSLNIDVLTMGNHVWDNKEIFGFVDDEHRLIRPANYPPYCPGQGYHVYSAAFNQKIAVVNASGRVFLPSLDCPFRVVDDIVAELQEKSDLIIVDFHAEATSEKLAFAHYFDGRVAAVLGTHTHVQTADEKILPRGTAYITDLGMTGPVDSILGMQKEQVIQKIITQRPVRLEVAKGACQIQAVALTFDEASHNCISIARISQKLPA
ncbi:MAG: TIGR00282 family metallophosphoesterase [Syntrophomonas sp.]|uniref:TIGR00282 family metallophosphoesterase n=1 Tax=Syntrophomonas sp. TaxID=2053627 RepID=UPI00261E572C|nr:TIGR00282 family metallophosphoesterase [Syntrophomonas sp.]MDD2509707.1 TIGR00282 family metallophosphoesterase [Syntrophomonas sp.]MDD3879408.1 TIGR00282 family metallophosphoesterase [Syntrophomonas sp.]MDD4625839.1 TIGR00282 family metallophosphoesterase [Syntrophomonas sp.]